MTSGIGNDGEPRASAPRSSSKSRKGRKQAVRGDGGIGGVGVGFGIGGGVGARDMTQQSEESSSSQSVDQPHHGALSKKAFSRHFSRRYLEPNEHFSTRLQEMAQLNKGPPPQRHEAFKDEGQNLSASQLNDATGIDVSSINLLSYNYPLKRQARKAQGELEEIQLAAGKEKLAEKLKKHKEDVARPRYQQDK